jgi:hypothetical protein
MQGENDGGAARLKNKTLILIEHKKWVMIKAGPHLLCIILVILAMTAGCSSGSGSKGISTPTIDPNTRFAPSNITYTNYGLSFEYPENLAMVSRGYFGAKNASWDDGQIQLKGESGDNITISWIRMHHIPPNIPLVYEGLWTSTKKDPRVSDVKIYNLQTYPSTTCGDASFIGRISFFDKARGLQANEGLMIWHNASQDRLYTIDITSTEDYFLFIKGNLARYQESFRCIEF